MSLFTRSASASMDTSTGEFAPQLTGLLAGEDLDPVAPCYIKTSDGKVYMSNGTGDNEAAEFDGFTPCAIKSGNPVTLFGLGARFKYGTSLSPGAYMYIGATAGRLDTAATTGGGAKIARVITDTDIRCINMFNTADGT